MHPNTKEIYIKKTPNQKKKEEKKRKMIKQFRLVSENP